MAERRSLFPSDIFIFRNPTAPEDNDRWSRAIYELKERDSGKVVSNYGGWHSSVALQTVPELTGLARFILRCIDEIVQQDGWDTDRFRLLLEGWANINGKGAANQLHNHPNTLLSGCYYVKVPPGSGDLLFRDPRDCAYVFQPPYKSGARTPVAGLTPEAGMLVIFPAWLHHAVGTNNSDSDRISVAFNATVDSKPSGKRPH